MTFLLIASLVLAAGAAAWAVALRLRLLACQEDAQAGRPAAYLEQLFEGAPEAIVLADNDSRVIRVNAECVRMFGYSAEESRGKLLDELLPPTELFEEAAAATRSVADGGRVSFETVRRRKDGTEIDVSVLGTPIEFGGGQIAVYGIYRDITELKRTVEARRLSEEKYRSILETIEDGYYEVDLAGNLTLFNGALQRMLGYPAERLTRMNGRDFMDQENAKRMHETFKAVYRSGVSAHTLGWEFVRADGSRRSAEASVTPVRDGSGRITGFRGIARDITERRRTERALRGSEERYALAARGANDGLWDWDLQSGKVYYSPRWKAMLGYSDGDLHGEPDDWFGRVHPQDLERLKSQIADHLDGPSSHFQNEHRILHKDGSYRWVLCRGVAERDGKGQATRMAGSQTDISERKRAEERLTHDAFHDVLTGLPNRSLFTSLLDRCIARLKRRYDYRFAVLFLDIDRFKVINDSLGHMVGDQLLVAASKRLASCLRPGDTVARLGGDEFTILLDDIIDEKDAIRVAERIQAELMAAFKIGSNEVFTSASIGIALSGPAYRRPEEILRDADTAMYRAKAGGKARHEVFDTDMHRHAVTLLKLETDLRRALERDEFRMVYQPIVALETGRLAGFEALLRWDHPERGLVTPTEFIALAEETGLIIPIGQWALREACRQLNQWLAIPRNGADPLMVSVNLSARQFEDRALVEIVADVLAVTGLPAASLKLEITESVLMDQAEASVRLLDDLRQSGVQVQIDDFGTGYSSLGYLHRFSLDALKIDQSFVSRVGLDNENSEIVRTIVALARNLGMTVVAEGVETIEQRNYLETLSCEHVQGFLFAGPLDVGEAEALIRSGRTW